MKLISRSAMKETKHITQRPFITYYMKHLFLLISPQAKGAYFNELVSVAKAELSWLIEPTHIDYQKTGMMEFLECEVDESRLPVLASMSFICGIFEKSGHQLIPLDITPDFVLHEDFVFGSKFKGKTSELLTQLLINVGLKTIGPVSNAKLLDPMCGRATTLLWGMRYGMKTRGIEQDQKAIADIRQSVKKWTKIHRQKHELKEGFVGKSNKQKQGKFIEFSAEGSSMKVITGDSSQASELLNGEKFHLVIADLPYGVQFTAGKPRNPLAVLENCAPEWVDTMKPDGAMVLAFNNYLPEREKLIDLFEEHGLEALEFSAPHRMSESIVRDIVIFRRNP